MKTCGSIIAFIVSTISLSTTTLAHNRESSTHRITDVDGEHKLSRMAAMSTLDPKYYCHWRCKLVAGFCGSTHMEGDAVVLPDGFTPFSCPTEEECIRKTCRFFPTLEEKNLCIQQCIDIVHAGYCTIDCPATNYQKCLQHHCTKPAVELP